jgi:hypothetical protein
MRGRKGARGGRLGLGGRPGPRLHKLLGETLAKLKSYDEAKAQFLRYLKLAPDASDAGEARSKALLMERQARLK